MNPLFPGALWLWAALLNLVSRGSGRPRARASAAGVALACLLAATASANEALELEVPQTQNAYVTAVATLYRQGRHEEALSKLEKALERKPNDPQEELWLQLMRGVLQVELAQGEPLESFKAALALDPQARLPLKRPSRRLRKFFEQARNTAGQPTDAELLKEELGLPLVASLPPRHHGLSLIVRGEGDVLGLSTTSPSTSPVIPAVGVGYTYERWGGVLTVLVQPSPGLRAEGQYHPYTVGRLRPYAGLGATAFFREQNAQGDYTFMGGVSGRGVLGVDVQLSSRMSVFVDAAYEHFLTGGERYKSQSVVFSVGVTLFP